MLQIQEMINKEGLLISNNGIGIIIEPDENGIKVTNCGDGKTICNCINLQNPDEFLFSAFLKLINWEKWKPI